MFARIAAYVSAHPYDVIVGSALVAVAILLEWSIMGRYYRAWFRRR